jgi:hypothetical protein
MLKLAETYFRLDLHLEQPDKIRLQQILVAVSYRKAEGLFSQNPRIVVYVDDGSTKVWIPVAGMLIYLISQYGSLRTGVDYAVRDSRSFSERIFAELRQSGISDDKILRTERRTGVPGKIKRTMGDIDNLEAHGRDLSKPEYDQQLEEVKDRLTKVLQLVEGEEDRALIVQSVPENIRDRLPKKIPQPIVDGIPVALRPEEIEAAPRKYLPWTALSGGSALISPSTQIVSIKREATYEVRASDGGFRFIRQ